jgi:hypothetical protein
LLDLGAPCPFERCLHVAKKLLEQRALSEKLKLTGS